MKKYIAPISISSAVIISIIFVMSVTAQSQPNIKKDVSLREKKEAKEMEIKTINPKILPQNDETIILGTVISHETANIFPRREGIIKDIYFDIGDEVQEGQIVASLLPRGVEGESEAMIAEKTARQQQAQTDLLYAQNVSKEAIANARQKVVEIEQSIIAAHENKDVAIKTALHFAENVRHEEDKKVESALQKIEVSKTNITSTKEAIIKAETDRDKKIERAEANIIQSIEQAEVSIIHLRQTIEQVLLGDIRANNRSSLKQLYDKDVAFELGALKPQARIDTVDAFNQLLDFENSFILLDANQKQEEINSFLSMALKTAHIVEDLLKGTITHMHFQQSELTKSINSVHSAKVNILKTKEKVENMLLGLKILNSSETEFISNLEQKLLEQEEQLLEVEKNVDLSRAQSTKNSSNKYDELEQIETMELNKIILLEEKMETAQQNLRLIETQQYKNIAKAREMVNVSKASLGTELAKSNHREIRSPFTGIISKRFIEVGQLVESSMSSFELIGVETSLAKKAKAEIKFGLPEGLINELSIGDSVEFFPVSNELESYKAMVRRISPQIDMASHTITIQAKIADNIDLPHHTSIRVRLNEKREPVYSVPSMSVKRMDDKNFIWILVEGEEKKIEVHVVSEDGEWAEVKGDINKKMEVVVNPVNLNSKKQISNSK